MKVETIVAGDYVVCIDSIGSYLIQGKIYKVERIELGSYLAIKIYKIKKITKRKNDDIIYVLDETNKIGGYYATRFKKSIKETRKNKLLKIFK